MRAVDGVPALADRSPGESRGQDMRGARRLVIIVLAIVAAALIVAVIAKYWPPEVERGVREALGWLRDEGVATWRRTGGRWVTLDPGGTRHRNGHRRAAS